MPKPLNILVLKSDEHNPFISSVYGHHMVHTPNMEYLAANGTTFDAAYCPSPLCMPSRSSYISGRRVHDIQFYSNCNVFEYGYPSYGRAMAEQGVYSALIGKTHVYAQSPVLGFSEIRLPGDRPPPCDPNISRHPLQIREGAHTRAGMFGPNNPDPFRVDDARMAESLDWLYNTAPGIEGPWSLEVNLSNPHFPQYVTPELWEMYPDGGDLPEHDADCESGRHPYAQDLRAHFETELFTEDQVRGLRRGYLGCVTYIDRQLGRLLDALRGIGALERTLVAYTSDHGDMLGKFGMWWKCTLFEDSVRVPTIVMGPGFAAGARVSTPVDAHDLRATMFAATGAAQPEGWLGTPLQGIATNDGERVVFSEYHGHGTRASAYMIRKGDWKLIWNAEAPHQLYNLADDPNELRNRYATSPDVVADLERELRAICSPELETQRAEEMILRQIEAVGRMEHIPPRRIP